MLTYLDHLKDSRVDCYSVLVNIKIEDYLNIIQTIYKKRGGLEGQRSPLKTKSAQRIRKRLVDDLDRGTVIPPIVVGIKLEEDKFAEFEKNIEDISPNIFNDSDIENIASIIDGMQRSTALYEALQKPKFDKSRKIRLELWVAKSTNSLIYRMLVLNSGQIPWNVKRQLEVVFMQLKKELEVNVKGLELFTSEDSLSRKRAGQYQASQFIELFMLFGVKRVNIDIQEELAEEFARLDIIETSGNADFMSMFYSISQILVNLDIELSRLEKQDGFELRKFQTGKKIFDSQPARAGFIVAASQEIFGIPGIEFSEEDQKKRATLLQTKLLSFIEKLRDIKEQEKLAEIIDLPTLDEQTNVKSSKVGEFERNFFLKAFKTFIDLAKNDSLTNLTPCWRSSY
ncbi:MAG: hypothetical protein QM660_05260 [Dysgonomonas sp.]